MLATLQHNEKRLNIVLCSGEKKKKNHNTILSKLVKTLPSNVSVSMGIGFPWSLIKNK